MRRIVADVAVVGAGVAGVTSAISVAEKGYSVALFEFANGIAEAAPFFGESKPGQKTDGSPSLAGINGIFAVETEFQNSRHHVTKKKDVYDYLLEHAHWDIDPRIVADFVNRSAEVYEWLARDGLKIDVAVSYFKDAPFTWLFFDKKGPRLPEILLGRLRKLPNCTVYGNVEIKSIIKQEGKVCGVRGVYVDGENKGEEIEAKTRAVVIATGEPGFGMGGPEQRDRSLRNLEMAVAIGAARAKDVYVGNASLDGMMMPDSLGNLRQPTQLIVNRDAERFTNEEVLKYLDETALNFAFQKDGIVFTIFDENINKYHEQHGWFYFFYGRGPQRPENTRAIFEQLIAQGANSLFLADSIEELAVKMGLNPSVLKKTVDEYNRVCATGRDPLMKDIRFLIPLTTPPFYGARMKSEVVKVPGPLRPSPKCEVLDKNLDPIPGLYAAGGACNILNHELYTHRIAGSRSTYALISGRILGESIPDYLKKNYG